MNSSHRTRTATNKSFHRTYGHVSVVLKRNLEKSELRLQGRKKERKRFREKKQGRVGEGGEGKKKSLREEKMEREGGPDTLTD